MPSSGSGMHGGWVGFGSDSDGGKFVENGWQNSWQSGQSGGNFGWDKKQSSDNSWDSSGKQKWYWGNGESHGWDTWDSDKSSQSGDWSGGTVQEPDFYTSWGNINTNSWKNHGGGEGWHKWEGWKLFCKL
uniref:Carbohydrate-binding protein n=1 Tax=Elaeophora elaphi TaxID=1147741 RepID=A0A0R3RN65_9BILA